MKTAVIGELELKQKSFRANSRLVAYLDENERVTFALQFTDAADPESGWQKDNFFTWHGENFDSIIRAAHRFHEQIDRVIEYEKKKCSLLPLPK